MHKRGRGGFYVVFYLLSFTWGILCSLPGALMALGLLIFGFKPFTVGPCVGFRVGACWGGASLGPFFVRDTTSDESVSFHEAGHSLQNILLGPFMIPLVCIPSSFRYRLRRVLEKYDPARAAKLSPYDSVWFEGSATKYGRLVFGPENEDENIEKSENERDGTV